MNEQQNARLQGGELLARVSNEIVQLLRQSTGRGPTECRSHWAGEDILLVVIKGGYSAAEHTIARAGHAAEVHAGRRALQYSIETQMRSLVEKATRRPVEAFMSNTHLDPDMMLEIFVLGR